MSVYGNRENDISTTTNWTTDFSRRTLGLSHVKSRLKLTYRNGEAPEWD